MSPGAPSGDPRRDIGPAQAFHDATQSHRDGRLCEAEQLYQRVIELEPAHFGALYLLGTIRAQAGRLGDALPVLRRAVDADPSSADAQLKLGAVLAALKRPEEAVACYRRGLAIEPRRAELHLALGHALQELDRPTDAIAHYVQALAIRPGYAEAHYNLGNALQTLRRPAEAVAHYEQALVARADFAEAYANLGNALLALGRPEQAVMRYQQAETLRPDDPRVHTNLANALVVLGRLAEAIAHFEKALAADADHAGAHHRSGSPLDALGRLKMAAFDGAGVGASNSAPARTHCDLGILLAALGRPDEAIAHYRRALAVEPGDADANRHLADLLQALNRPGEAIAHCKKVLAVRPDDADAGSRYATSLQQLGRFKEAIALYERTLAIEPDHADAHRNLGSALMALNRHEDAIRHFEKALAVEPSRVEVHNNIGVALQALGRIEEAHLAYEKAIAGAPGNATIHLNLASIKPFTAGDPRLVRMETLAQDAARLDEEHRIALHFALGKAYADLRQHAQSFRQLAEGNALKRRRVAYDETATLRFLERMRATFTPELMQRKGGSGEPSATPVFVVGIPRSGTTLVEQILASHSKVFGAGEVEDFHQAVVRAGLVDGGAMFPERVSTAPWETLHRLGSSYLDAIRAAAPTAERIVDKMPLNYLFIGLIRLVLPNARIIHARRDPVDTCFSCFSLLFTGNQPYTYDLGELGRYYRAYQALMAHWRSVLPQGVMLDVQYEDVIDDVEAQARRIVAHCGLDWEDACLAFHKTQRVVNTASATQVRQPIYRNSIGRWRPYKEWLQPLLAALHTGEGGPPT